MLFPLPVKAEIPDSFAMPSRVLRYNLGAKQVAKQGLERPNEVWDISVVFSDTTLGATLQAFLETHMQHVVFQWQSPRDLMPQNYRIFGEVGGTKRNGGGREPVFFMRQMKFKRVY